MKIPVPVVLLLSVATVCLCEDHDHKVGGINSLKDDNKESALASTHSGDDPGKEDNHDSRRSGHDLEQHLDDHGHDHHDRDDHGHHDTVADTAVHTSGHESVTNYKVWLAASGAILVISLCGIFGVLVIPIMQRVFYQHLTQFLIALAIGTLAGDALLHLLPHAFQAGVGHRSHGGEHKHHQTTVWQGFVALISVIVFFLFEKLINVLGEWREEAAAAKRRMTPTNRKLRVVREGHAISDKAVGERLCKHKYSSYCVDDLDLENIKKKDDEEAGGGKTTPESELDPSSSRSLLPAVSDSVLNTHYSGLPPVVEEHHDHHHHHDEDHDTVIISQHEVVHHGHSHAHSHLHSTPESISSVAWMVIFGDAIHNLADGLAIGAAFAEGYTSGLSTSVAVLCHELPHEIGDFAMLLKAGMSVKQAVFYNVLSSFFALLGMIVGFLLGTIDHFTPWLFTAVAGIFLYVALVDMMPELSSGHSHPISKHAQFECVGTEIILQVSGMSLGAIIMLLIALFEHDMKEALHEI